MPSTQRDVWTDDPNDKREPRGRAPVPLGKQGTQCTKCRSPRITGVLITPTADEADPNLFCCECGYGWD